MTIDALRKYVLALVDEQKPQTGMTNRMNIFMDMGQKEIATTASFIYRDLPVVCEGSFIDVSIPENYYALDKIYSVHKGARTQYKGYIWLDNHTLRLTGKGDYIIAYRAYPETITLTTAPTHLLEINEEAQLALVLYVAAQLFAAESEQQYFQVYFSQYQGKLANIANKRIVSIVREGIV